MDDPRQLAISPKLLDVVQDDPEALARLHRVQRALLSDVATRRLLHDPDASPTQFASMIEALRKAEASYKEDRQNGGGPGLTLNIIAPDGSTVGFEARRAIEGTATEVDED